MNTRDFRQVLRSTRATPLRGPHVPRIARYSTALFALCLAPGCGDVAEAELFQHASQALVEQMGESCESYPVASTAIEVDVDDNHPTCEPGMCVTKSGQPGASEGFGICSCRCDGPKETGALCSCTEGFKCEELVPDFNLDQNRHLIGSYCMPL